jgi:hypothetical protein
MASGQMPSMDTISSDRPVPTAMRAPANCQASSATTAMVGSAGSPVSRLCAQASVASIGSRADWKAGRACSTTQPRP